MTDLLKSDRAWTWGYPQQKVFDKVTETISSSTGLAFYDLQKPSVVCADVSGYGIGGVLMQDHGDQLCPVAFCSRTLTETEVISTLKLRRSAWQLYGHARDYHVTWLGFQLSSS